MPLPDPGGGAVLSRAEGLRLGHLASRRLVVECACGHKGVVAVAPLIARHGPAARVRDAFAALRCSACGNTTIRAAHLLP